VALARKQKLWLAVWGFYVVTLLPVLGIVQVGRQAMADRYMYLPSVGPFLVIGLVITWFFAKVNSPDRRWPVGKFLTIFIAVLLFSSISYLTLKQIGIWRNDMVLWSYVITKDPDNYLAHYIRSFTFKMKGQLDKAMEDSDKAIALNPAYLPSYQNRADIFEKKGLFDKALADYDKAIALNPSKPEMYYKRGTLFEKVGQHKKAAADYDKVVALNPLHYEAYYNRGVLSLDEGSRDEALSFFNRSIAANPNYDRAYASRGALYSFLGHADRALEDLNNAILLNQKNAMALDERGNIYLRSGRKEEKELALSDFRAACNLGNKNGCDSLFKLEGVVIDIRDVPFKGKNDAKLALIEFSDYQ
jgi:tetratricopeptide (TPR) repeat protein